ncbi:hypothetical protein I302_106414 [Kwoniella bestiolae CBS 10118]|uniref:Phytanoyl-CoA dioxygenase n=1 Tax=Kwoniella bestiolae CBS 10118 TaxID=1296100 RepID=A0A1B9G1G8_9TREE|nr:hypothetical protein I302_06328 [Kwoniella bestiolae CBS 10118]OCF24867.1 hypothetical protein I302_06328 [Kwoniella bestiolae CBS 10118]
MTSPWATKYTLNDLVIDASAPPEEMQGLLKKTGAIVLKGLIKPEDISNMMSDFKPHLDALGHSGAGGQWEGSFFPATTKKIPGLATKSRTWVDKVLLNPVLGGLADFALTRRTKTTISQPGQWSTCKPEINLSGLLEIHPGGDRQDLHRDDALFHQKVVAASDWTPRREHSIVTLLALSKVTTANGGTLVIPESHLKGDDIPPPAYEDCLTVEMEAGDCIVIFGSTYHAGGSNTTKVDEPDSVRTMCVTGYKVGYLKQEENQYLQHDIEEIKKLPLAAQKILGWDLAVPYMGYVNWLHPLLTLGYDPKDVPQGDDLFYDRQQGSEVLAI